MLFPKTILKRQAVKSTLYAMFGEGFNVKLETATIGEGVSIHQAVADGVGRAFHWWEV